MLSGGERAEVLVRTHVVVSESELAQRQDRLSSAFDFCSPEFGFQRTEKVLDAAVLPRTANLGGPVAPT